MADALVQPRCTPDHPPYAEMITDAIRSLNEEGGSSDKSISSYIESHYQNLPPAHSNLFSYHFSKLIRLGEIDQTTPNSYTVPSNDNPTTPNPSPPRRRGGPSKARSPSAKPLSDGASKRRHGRPQKDSPRSELPVPVTESLVDDGGGGKRKRHCQPTEGDNPDNAGFSPPPGQAAAINGGDVPAKLKPTGGKNAELLPPSGEAATSGGDVPLPRRRGRPPKPKDDGVLGSQGKERQGMKRRGGP